MTLNLSYSGATTWRECQQRYWYRYVEKVKPKVFSAPLTLGNWLHSYCERYYKAIRHGVSPEEAHGYALAGTETQYEPELKGYVAIAIASKQDELAEELEGLAPFGVALATRYYEARGKDDAEQYEILIVEERLNHPADDTTRVPAVVDLVVRDKDAGTVQMWDHKSTKNVPRSDSHTLDLQLPLYAAIVSESHNLEIDFLLWNYLRTALPREPKILKSGALSRDKGMDTDAATYRKAIEDNNLDVEDYTAELERLEPRLHSVFFPRHKQKLHVDAEAVIIGDFLRTSKEIQRAKDDEEFIAIRNIGRSCQWCDYSRLCKAVVTGGDTEQLIARHYT